MFRGIQGFGVATFASEHPSSVAVEQVFKKEVARLTSNQLQVDVFPAMQLGGAKESVDAARSGTLALTWVGATYLSRIVPEIEAVALPFVFPNRKVALRVIDGPVGDAIEKKLQDKGFNSLGWMDWACATSPTAAARSPAWPT